MVNVVAIHTSKRKMNTYNIICQVKDILNRNDIEVEIINLYDYDVKDCIGCECCILSDKCVVNDNVAEVLDKIKNSDGIILTSPVYLQAVSGKLKTFVDRTCKWFHRPEIYGKPVLVIATTKGSGLKSTLKYLDKIVIQWGGITAGSIGRSIRNITENVTEKECENFIHHLKMDKKNYKPSLESLINFQVQKILSKHLNGLDEIYWKEKDWNNNIYYFDCKISVVNKMVAKAIYKIINRAMSK